MATRFFRNTNKTPQQLMQELEERLKLNRGSGLLFAEDTGYQPRSVLPGYRMTADPTGFQASVAPQQVAMPDRPQAEPLPQMQVPNAFEQDGDVLGVSDTPTVDEFLSGFTRSLYAPQAQSTAYLDALYQATGTPYGIASLQDGTILMNDGSISTGEQAIPVATMMDGRILFSDGSTRRVSPQVAGQMGGVEGLSQGLFGRQQTVTQPFGNYNPDLYGQYGGTSNIGVDFRTRDLPTQSFTFPVSARVVDVIADDGRNPYGNSVLLELASGERLRLSHLAVLPQVQPGQMVAPGQLTLTPGATGNVTGEHLDVEYYNAQGQLDNPANFSGFVEPIQYIQDVETAASQQPAPNKPIFERELGLQQPQQQAMQTFMDNPVTALTAPAAQAIATQAQPGSATRQAVATGVESAGTALKAPELGFSETAAFGPEAGKQARVEAIKSGDYAYNPYRQLAGNVTERIGDVLGIPEGAFSETLAGGQTKRTGVALASDIGVNQSQQVPGIRQNIADIAQDVVGRAGAGIDRLKQGVSGAIAGLRPSPAISDLGTKKVVGGEAGSAPASFGAVSSVRPGLNDTRDPFFKTPQAQALSQYLTPDAAERGVLDTQAFTPGFFQDQSRISSVFGGSIYQAPAEQKFAAYQAEQARLQAEAAQRAYENEIRNQLRSRGLDEGQISQFISEGRVFDPVTQTSSAPGGVWNTPEDGSPMPQSVSQIMSSPGGARVYEQAARSASPQTSTIRYDSSGNRQAVPNREVAFRSGAMTDTSAPVKSQSAQLVRPASPPKNIFTQAVKTISNIFRRK